MWWFVFVPCQYFVSVVAFKLLNTEASKSRTGHQLSVRTICGELKWRSRLLKCFSQTAFGQTEITFPSVRACGMKQSLVHQQTHPHTHGFQTNTVVLTGVQRHTLKHTHAKHHKTGARGFSSPHKCVASMPDGPCMCRKQVHPPLLWAEYKKIQRPSITNLEYDLL